MYSLLIKCLQAMKAEWMCEATAKQGPGIRGCQSSVSFLVSNIPLLQMNGRWSAAIQLDTI